MKDIKEVSKVVEHILKHNEDSRNSDNELYAWVSLYYNQDVMRIPFTEVLRNQKSLGIPKFETVRRARQKIQSGNPELRAKKSVEDMRYENWKAVMDYVGQ